MNDVVDCTHRDRVWEQRVEYMHRSRKDRKACIGVRWMCLNCAESSVAVVRKVNGAMVTVIEQLVVYLRDPTDDAWQAIVRTMEPMMHEQGGLF
jgi:hypothetical protein